MAARIIVAYDGSALSQEAFAYSVTLAKAIGASIVGAHVLEPLPPPIIAEGMAGIDATPAMAEFDDAARQDVEKEQTRFEREFEKLGEQCAAESIPFESRVDVGLLVPALVEMAGAEDLIAVGMKGRFARAGLGSSARSLMKKAPCPVLIASGPRRPIRRVLSVFDGSSVSKKAIAKAKELSEQAGWPLTILATEGGDTELSQAIERAQELAPDAKIVSSGVDGATEAEQIEQAAAQADDAIVVMGAYSDSWLHQLISGFGGATARVLARVGAPVVMVH